MRDFAPERKWLIDNNIKFSHFEEEIKYQEGLEKFNLSLKAGYLAELDKFNEQKQEEKR